MNNLFVCVFGMGTVFVGLICLILLVDIMGKICQSTDKKPAAAAPVATPAAAPVAAPADKAQLIAAVSAVIAEEMGTDVSGLRILSMKKI